jgi:dipeptide/tripeptide permease
VFIILFMAVVVVGAAMMFAGYKIVFAGAIVSGAAVVFASIALIVIGLSFVLPNTQHTTSDHHTPNAQHQSIKQ